MSIKKEYMTTTHEVTEQICVKQTQVSDICGKEINKSYQGYWTVNTHHNDWDINSCESYEYFDVCSQECLWNLFIDYIENSKKGWNSKCFDIKHHNN